MASCLSQNGLAVAPDHAGPFRVYDTAPFPRSSLLITVVRVWMMVLELGCDRWAEVEAGKAASAPFAQHDAQKPKEKEQPGRIGEIGCKNMEKEEGRENERKKGKTWAVRRPVESWRPMCPGATTAPLIVHCDFVDVPLVQGVQHKSTRSTVEDL